MHRNSVSWFRPAEAQSTSSLPRWAFEGELDTPSFPKRARACPAATDTSGGASGEGVSFSGFPFRSSPALFSTVTGPSQGSLPVLEPAHSWTNQARQLQWIALASRQRQELSRWHGLSWTRSHAPRKRNPLPNGGLRSRHEKTVVEFRGFPESLVA
jgi:hypothetical protein